jgi:predicted Zn-dependent peptidase
LPLESLDEMLARVDAVTLEEVAALANDFYAPDSLAAACVGPDKARFRDAAGHVSEALVA